MIEVWATEIWQCEGSSDGLLVHIRTMLLCIRMSWSVMSARSGISEIMVQQCPGMATLYAPLLLLAPLTSGLHCIMKETSHAPAQQSLHELP